MNKVITLSLAILFSFIFHGKAFSQDENYDAIYLQITKEYTLNPDGSMDYHYIKKLKLQTFRSFNSLYGETFITYHPDYQTLKVNEAFIIMAGGKKVASPSNAFNEVLPAFAANAPAYNKLREMVITHTGTERNAVINLDYTLHTKKGFYPALMGNEVLAETEPVKDLTIKVKIPAGEKLNYVVGYSEIKPVITTEGAFSVYTWNLKDIPAISAEENQVSGYELYPRLLFSTAKSRQEAISGLLAQPAFSGELPAEAKAMADSLVTKMPESSKLDGILSLQNMVVNDMRLYPIPMRYNGFKGRSPAETWNSNGGTMLDKTILLYSLIRQSGAIVDPYFVVKSAYCGNDIGNLLDIEDMGVKVELKDAGIFYISATARNPQNLSWNLPSRSVLFMESNGKLKTVPCENIRNKTKLLATLAVNDKNQLSGEISLQFDNGVNPYYLLEKDKSKSKSYVTGGLSTGDLKEIKIATITPESSFFDITVEKDKPFRKDSSYYFFTLPVLSNGIESWGIHLLPKERLTPLEVPFLIDEVYDFTITLPKGLSLFSAEKKTEIKNDAGTFYFEIHKDGDNVNIKKSLKIDKRIIDSGLPYTDFKALMDHWNNDNYREVVFVK
jgi:hypothetical protein